MNQIREVDYLMAMNESGVITHDEAMATLNNVQEWFDTPRGEIYGRPGWGNELAEFKHEPTGSEYTAMDIEFSIIHGLTRDIPSLVINAIYCNAHPTEIDRYNIFLGLPSGPMDITL